MRTSDHELLRAGTIAGSAARPPTAERPTPEASAGPVLLNTPGMTAGPGARVGITPPGGTAEPAGRGAIGPTSGPAGLGTPADYAPAPPGSAGQVPSSPGPGGGYPGSRAAVLHLQGAAGNAAVTRLVGGAAPRALAPAGASAAVAENPPVAALPPVTELPADAVADPETAAVVSHQSARVLAAAAESEQALDAAVATERARLTAHFAQQEVQADTGRAAATARITGGATAAQARVTGAAQAARGQVTSQAGTAQEATGAQVTAMSTAAQSEAETQAARATATAASLVDGAKAPPTSGDADVASGQARIDDAVAGRARSELPAAGAQTADAVRSRSVERQEQVYGPARAQATSQVQEGVQQAAAAITSGETTAAGAVAATSTHAASAVGAAHMRARQALAAGRRTALAALEQWATAARCRVRAAASQLAASLGAQGATLAGMKPRMRHRAAATATQSLVDAGDEAVSAVGDSTTSLLQGMAQLAGGHADAVGGVGDRLASGFGSAGDAAVGAMQRPAEAYGRTAQQAGDEAGNELAQAPTRVTGALAAEHERGLAETSGVVDRAAAQQRSWATDAGSKAKTGSASYADEATRLRGEADQAPVQGLFGELITGMRSWLRDKLGDVLGGIVSGIILALPAIAVAVVLLFAGPVGWGVLALLVVVGAGLGIAGRFSDYAADHGGQGPSFWEGVALVGLGIADITGIPYIVEAAVGQRAFAPEPMTTFERWERGTQGVINLALVVAGGAKKLFGRGVGGEPVPTERVPVPRERVPDPGERVPVPGERGPVPGERGPTPVEGETPAPRGPITKARMTELIKQIDSGEPIQFTAEHADALRLNAELATTRTFAPESGTGRIRWASIKSQMGLSRWRFLPRAPEAAQVLRAGLERLPEGPERAELIRMLDGWTGGGAGGSGIPVPAPRDEDDATE